MLFHEDFLPNSFNFVSEIFKISILFKIKPYNISFYFHLKQLFICKYKINFNLKFYKLLNIMKSYLTNVL